MALVKCAAYIAVTGIASFIIGTALPRKWLHADQFLFRCRSFEREGRVYEMKIMTRYTEKRENGNTKGFPAMTE